MANTLLTINGFPTGYNTYALVYQDSDDKVYNTSTKEYEVYNAANWGLYAIALVEVSPNLYTSSLPTEAQTETYINVTYYKRTGASPAVEDVSIGAETLTITSFSPEVGDLLTLAEYKLLTPDNELDDAHAQFLISACSEMITNYLRFNYAKTITEDYYLSGNDLTKIELRSQPVNAAITITINGETPQSTLGLTSAGWLYFTDGSYFPSGISPNNIRVQYTSVSTDVPKPIKAAVAKLVQIMTWYISSDAEVKSKTEDKLSISWDIALGDDADVFSPVVAMLSKYKHLVLI
jgi:hypothetical protein